MSAYTFFVQTCRDEHRRWYPEENVNFTEFSKKCSARWKLMTDEQKSRFVEMSNGDKHRYESEMARYNPPSGECSRKRKKRDPLAPKRPLSAFFLFCQEERPKVREERPNASISEIAKVMGEKWSKIDAERKKSYEEEAIRAKASYDKEAAAYREKIQQEQAAAAAAAAASAPKRVAQPSQGMMSPAMSHLSAHNGTVPGPDMHHHPQQSNSMSAQQQQQCLAGTMDFCPGSASHHQQQMGRMPTSYQQQMLLLNNAAGQQGGNGTGQQMMSCLGQQSSECQQQSSQLAAHMYHLNSASQMMHHHPSMAHQQQQQMLSHHHLNAFAAQQASSQQQMVASSQQQQDNQFLQSCVGHQPGQDMGNGSVDDL